MLLHRLVNEALEDRIFLSVNRPDISNHLLTVPLPHLFQLGRDRLQDQLHLILQKLDGLLAAQSQSRNSIWSQQQTTAKSIYHQK